MKAQRIKAKVTNIELRKLKAKRTPLEPLQMPFGGCMMRMYTQNLHVHFTMDYYTND